jgi:hypothetical protein
MKGAREWLTQEAALRSQPASVQEQERRGRGHERGRDSQGESGEGRERVERGWQANGANGAQGLQLEDIKTHKWHIMACSAMTGMNLHEGLEWVVQDAKARLFLY